MCPSDTKQILSEVIPDAMDNEGDIRGDNVAQDIDDMNHKVSARIDKALNTCHLWYIKSRSHNVKMFLVCRPFS
jgi:hypothetical protein